MKNRYILTEWMNEYYAIPITDVEEIMEIEDMIQTNFRHVNVTAANRRTIPVIDPVALLSIDPIVPSPKTKIVVVEKRQMKFGLLVDQVLGAIEIKEEEVAEPHMNEKRYVVGVSKRIKVVNVDAFLTQDMITMFKEIYTHETSILQKGYRIEGSRSLGKEAVLNQIRIKSLNFLIHATKRNMEETVLDEVMGIHHLVEKL